MKRILNFLLRRDVSRGIWVIGLALVAVGQTLAASNDDFDDTISEFVDDQSLFVKIIIGAGLGALASHWGKWLISSKSSTTIQAQTIEHMTIEKAEVTEAK